MHKLFFPESVVVFGVSPDQANLAKYIVMNLGLFNYQGRVYCVGRDSGEVFGKAIHKSVAEIGCAPELAVFLIPARAIPEAVEACGKAGIKQAIIESGGFSEFADSGRKLEAELLEAAARHGMRFVGPNCISIINMENGMALPFIPLDPTKTKKGPVSVLAQSGGIIVDFMRLFELDNVGFSKMVSMGNKLNLDESDFLEYLAGDDATKVIIMHLESISNGEKLMDIASRTDKPIIVIKANNSPGGKEIARFHTSAVAGDDEVASAAFRQAGMYRLPNLKEAMDFVKVLSLPPMKGPNLGILCRSGGQAVILADAAHKHGFHRARFTQEFFAMVQKECRAGVIRPTNPLDLGDIFDFSAYIKILENTLAQDEVDGVLLYHGYLGEFELEMTKKLLKASHELSWKYGKPVLFFMISTKEHWFNFKTMTDLPVFSEPDSAIKALGLSYSHQLRIARKEPPAVTYASRPRPARAAGSTAQARSLDTVSAFSLLERYGLPVIPHRYVNDPEECLRGAAALGYPVALKMGDAEVLHKTEKKGVVLNIGTPGDLEREFAALRERQGSGGLVLQKMSPAGRELLLGGKRDREFGPVVVFGLGGIFVELLRDVSMRVAPVSTREALEMVNEIRGAGILKQFRGKPEADIEALIEYIRRFSVLISERPEIMSIDVNPLILLDRGMGGCIVDAKIEALI